MGIGIEYNSQDTPDKHHVDSRQTRITHKICKPVEQCFLPLLYPSGSIHFSVFRVSNENFCTRIWCQGTSFIEVSVRMLPNFSGLHSYLWKCPWQIKFSFVPRNRKPSKRYIGKFSSHGESFAKWSRKSARILVRSTSGDSNSQSDRFALFYGSISVAAA